MSGRIGLARLGWVLALAIALLALGAWRSACVLAGPDVDTDAYAHHMIARAILADPRDLSVHWVWLPLFHYLQVPLVALGGTMQQVRWGNVVLAALVPVVLFAYVRATSRSHEGRVPADATALLAALYAAACPITMQMGTTAQPEPLFSLVILGVAIETQRRRHLSAALLLGAAVMLRYEAWAVLATLGIVALIEVRRPQRDTRMGWVVAVPAALILGWAALREPVDGQWFGFLRQTREFASDALHQKTGWERGLLGLARDALHYPLAVPVRVLGPALPLAVFGVGRTVRQQGGRFVLVFLACLAFVSLTWVMRSSLGLDRHFVAVVPLYATFAAQGAATIADWCARRGRRFWTERTAARAGAGLASGLAVASLGGLLIALNVWMGFWRVSVERGWPDRAELAAYLRSLPSTQPIFCDEATIEILSGLDRRRFDRHWVDDPHTWELVDEAARARGGAYVATWRRKMRGHEREGDIVFSAGVDAASDASGLAVMRIAP